MIEEPKSAEAPTLPNPVKVGHLRRLWERHEDRPFVRLVQLSLTRMLQGGQGESEDIDASVGRTLMLLALPGMFITFVLFDKYGSFLNWLRGRRIDAVASSVSDEYLFITLSMAVCGAVAAWKADSVFLDRRDYFTLTPLPVRTRTIMLANFSAVMLFSLLFTIDVNAVSGWMFPAVVAAAEGSVGYFALLGFSHVVAVGAASLFSFACVFGVIGLAMSLLPDAAFRRIAIHLNSAIVVAMLALLSTTYSMPQMIARGEPVAESALRYVPSLWFVGLCQRLRGATTGVAVDLAPWAGIGLVIASAAAVVTYAVHFRRHFLRIGEMVDGPGETAGNTRWFAPVGALLEALVLHTPFERAGFRFIFRTLARSPRHRLVLAGFIGAGAILSLQVLANGRDEGNGALPNVAWLSVGFILNFCVIAGLRFVFDLPAELRANWTFQLLAEPAARCMPLARTVLWTVVLSLTWTVEFGVYAGKWGGGVAVENAVVVAILSMLLADVTVVNFRKLPFTCEYPTFKQNAIAGLLVVGVAFVAFAFGVPVIERWALVNPWRLTVFVPLLAGGWYAIARYRSALDEAERQLTFDEGTPHAVQLLNLDAQ